jgi:hypothetical protein
VELKQPDLFAADRYKFHTLGNGSVKLVAELLAIKLYPVSSGFAD